MIRIYLDWNVMSQMKNGQLTHLSDILADKAKFFKVYSTSHIGDIAASNQATPNQENIQSDLDYISDLTDDFCVFNDGKEIVIGQYSPHELYNERTDLKTVLSTFNFDGLVKTIGGDNEEFVQLIKPLLDTLREMPIDNVSKDAFNNPKTASSMRLFLPDLEDNYTMKGVINAIIKMFVRLNEQGDYQQLREMVQAGLKINRDKVYAANDPYKLIDESYRKLGIAYPEVPGNEKNAPAWYSELTNEYMKLDMHGYQEDKVNVKKGRKETFRNTTEDAFHTAFATTCDFYITSDKKNYKKAQMIYEKLRINTLVLTPSEFIEHYNQWLHFKDGSKFLGIISAVLQIGEPHLSEDGLQKTYFQPLFIFDYFNKIYVWFHEETAENTIMLSREKPTNNKSIFKKELEAIIDKLLATFGVDIDHLNRFHNQELLIITDNSWPGRKWVHNGIVYHLRMLNGFLQLYLNKPD